MFCKRAIYVNWGNIPNMEFDFGPINLFSGGNGSGKTTAADGLQSLLTAAHENLFTYNPGQDETTQKGRGGKQVRTLASYVLGCDDGSYARTHMTDGYIAGIFHPTKGEGGDAFTAVMCVRARLDNASSPRQARQDELIFLIIPGHELSLSHFVKEEKSGKYVVPITEIAQSLKMQLGKSAVELYDKKGNYLKRLYGAFRGMPGAVSDREAKHAARTFSNFMAYKPVKGISDFVANQILEPKDIADDIRQVSELMKTIHGMEEDTRHINDAITNLDSALSHSDDYINNWVDRCLTNYAEIARQSIVKQAEYLKVKEDQRANTQSIEEAQRQIKLANEKKIQSHERWVEMEAQRKGIDVLKTKDELEQRIEACKNDLVTKVPTLLEQDKQFKKNHTAVTELGKKLSLLSLGVEIPFIDSPDFQKSLRAVITAPSDTDLNTQKLLTKDWVGISSLEHSLDQVVDLEKLHINIASVIHDADRNSTEGSLRDQILSIEIDKKNHMNRFADQVKQKELEIKRLETHNVNYPPHVTAALDAIEAQCPAAKPTVLCDFIEVTDPKWQMAIEGYIGGARFSIIVEPEHEAQAIRIVRSMKGRRNSAKIIQGSKAQKDARRITVHSDSIVQVMQFEHKIAEYYLLASYGNVLKVNNEEALKQTARGVTADGLGSGSYSMFRCDINDAELVFGQGARERALLAKREELSHLSTHRDNTETQYHSVARIRTLMDQIQTINCTVIINEMLSLYAEMQNSETQLETLDLSDFEELESRLAALKEEHALYDNKVQSLIEQQGARREQAESIILKIDRLEDEKERLQAAKDEKEQAVLSAADIYPQLESAVKLGRADEQAKQAGSAFNFNEHLQQAEARLDQAEKKIYLLVLEHNQHSTSYNKIEYLDALGIKHDEGYFKTIINLKAQIGGLYNALKNNVLAGKHEELSGLKESFNTAFVTNLCHSIYQAINDGKRVLEDLNKELQHHVFGADLESFSFSYEWVPEFYEYYRFFKEVIETPSLGDGTTLFDAELTEKSCDVRDKLLAMLLDKDTQSALRELDRISDYRHYRRYEIYKKPLKKDRIALSKYGTGSGGQLETPAYIIRSAAVTSAFKFNEGNAHCRMVLVDEAFSKMDETRSREVINYLTEALGLQLIFIMPTSKSGPFLDLISNQVVFSKCPTTEKVGELETRVLVDRKSCNQEKIQALWENHRKTVREQTMLDFMDEFV